MVNLGVIKIFEFVEVNFELFELGLFILKKRLFNLL